MFVLINSMNQVYMHYYANKVYESEKGAKTACTKLNKKQNTNDWRVIAESEIPAPKMVTRRNMMSGLEYEEAENTPAFLSPACESYWSM